MNIGGALQMTRVTKLCTTRLDVYLESLSPDVDPASASVLLNQLALELRKFRACCDADAWRCAVAQMRRHPLAQVLHEDPLTRRSAEQPRGYQGDAELIDLIYDGNPDAHGIRVSTRRAASLYAWSHLGHAPSAVRRRREFLGRFLDHEASHRHRPRALSVACGHLREVEKSQAFRDGQFGEVVGIDQDAVTIASATQRHRDANVRLRRAGVQSLMAGREAGERYDIIWSAGLFDYLDDELARQLTEQLFSMLKPGGVAAIANFLPEIHDVGYMEAFMDWWLRYRSKDLLVDLARDIDKREMESIDVVDDGHSHIAYLIVRRK